MKTPPTTAAMFPGVVGQLIEASLASTEADNANVAAQFLVALGAVIGRGPYLLVGETIHHVNENLLIVGETSVAGKGDGANVALMPILDVASPWHPRSGLSSGEGLIHHVRDPVYDVNRKGELVLRDAGVEDKRLCILETEMVGALKCSRREGNTLSNTMRDAWDGKPVLSTLTKNSPERATGAHVAIIGHITPEDLRAHLSDLDVANGFGNRFLFVTVRRCRDLPSPPPVPQSARVALVEAVADILSHASGVGQLARTPAADARWAWCYPELKQRRPGLLGAILARGPAHVCRLSALFALCARATAIDVPHLESAFAWWVYAIASAEIIFAHRTGNDVVDRIQAEMVPGEQMDLRTMRSQLFNNHISSGRLRDGLALARQLGLVQTERQDTGGRPRHVVTRLATAADTGEAP
jgi:hypothetical protein